MQANLKNFLEKVERKTEELRQNPPEDQITPIYDPTEEQQVANEMVKIWNSSYNLDFDRFLEICLAVLERREEDYQNLVKDLKKETLSIYTKLFGLLLKFFTYDYHYGDPLGTFYMQTQSYGRNGEYYTPYPVCYCMAKMLNPEPNKKVLDPCVGSGAMLLATRQVIHEKHGWVESSRFGRNLYGMDISNNAVRMAKIQLYLTDYIYMSLLLIDTLQKFIK